MAESDIKRAVLDALHAIGIRAMSNALGGRKYRTGLGPGSPDVVVVLPPHGTFVALELKVPESGKQSDAQKAWQKAHERDGGYYFVVRSVDEAIAVVMATREQLRRAG